MTGHTNYSKTHGQVARLLAQTEEVMGLLSEFRDACERKGVLGKRNAKNVGMAWRSLSEASSLLRATATSLEGETNRDE